MVVKFLSLQYSDDSHHRLIEILSCIGGALVIYGRRPIYKREPKSCICPKPVLRKGKFYLYNI